MSYPKLRSIPLIPDLTPLRPEREMFPVRRAWQLVSARGSESCRWECSDGSFVALTLGMDDELGKVVVIDSSGRREAVESYEAALSLARSWRTL